MKRIRVWLAGLLLFGTLTACAAPGCEGDDFAPTGDDEYEMECDD